MTYDIIILGQGSSRWLCPFDAEVWSVNNGYMQIAEMKGHVSKIFYSHPQHLIRFRHGIDNAYMFDQIQMLMDHNVEVFNIHKFDGIDHKMYPLDEIIEKFGTKFFSNGICYMIAYALHLWTEKRDRVVLTEPEKPHRIRMYGVDMATFDAMRGSGEYQLEKGGVEYWIGYAQGLGVTFEIGEGSHVCKTITGFPYGVQYFDWDDIDSNHLLDRKKYEGLTF